MDFNRPKLNMIKFQIVINSVLRILDDRGVNVLKSEKIK